MSNELVDPLPGTHKDVFIYEFYKTIGIFYEDPNNTLFGSEFFFYDYEDCQRKFLRGLEDLKSKKYIELKSRDQNKISNEELREVSPLQIPTRMIYETDMFMEIYEAWMLSLVKRKISPNPRIVDPNGIKANAFVDEYQYKRINVFRQGYGGIAGGFDILDIQIPLLKQTIEMVTGKNIKSGKPTELDKKLERHPLAHYPPLYPYNYLEDVVFYDPANKGISYSKLQAQYGPIVSSQMMSAFNSYGKKITYADIIKPFGSMGYGVIIDFRPFGYNNYSVQTWWEYYTYRTFYLDEIWEAHRGFEWECTNNKRNKGYCANVGQTVREFSVSDPYNSESELLKYVFRSRDSWIHYWLKGGRIPLEQEMNLLMDNIENRLKPFFPIIIAHPGNEDLMKRVALKITALVVTAIITYYTGGVSSLFMTMISEIIVPKFLNRFNVDAETQMALNMVYSMALNQYKDINDKDVKADEAFKFIMKSVETDFSEFRDRNINIQDVKNILVSYDDAVTDRQKIILELLGRSRSSRLNEFMKDNGSTSEYDIGTGEIDEEAVFKIEKARSFGSESDILKFGSIALAAIAAYKLLK